MSDRLRGPDGAIPRVLVAGGGVAALEAVLALRACAGMRVDIELIAPDAELRYPPLDLVEPFGLVPPRVQLAEALESVGARQRRDAIEDVDTGEHRVRTGDGAELPYGALVLAIGARRLPPPQGMLVYGDPSSRAAFARLLGAAEQGQIEHLLFSVPFGVQWSLPLYELAVMTARRLAGRGVRIAIVSPEKAPLEIFGGRASGRLLEHLQSLGIAFVWGTHVERVVRGEVVLAYGARRLPADRVVTIPTLGGPALSGVPHDDDGFIPVDRHGAVLGVPDVYAAGDATDFPVKQGGLATQQADAVAEAIAARTGALVDAAPFQPVLRGMLLTGEAPHYLEADVGERRRAPTGASTPLWWPPAKIAGRYLSPFLADHLGEKPPGEEEPPPRLGRGRRPGRARRRGTGDAVSTADGSAARVVVAGGGVAGLEALLALRRAAAGRVDLTLIAPEPEFTYRPLAVLEPFAPGSMPTLSIAEVAAEHRVALVADALAAVRTAERVAITRDGTQVPYDELVVAVGAQPQRVVAGAIALGSLAHVSALAKLVEDVRTGVVRRVALVVPEGIAWTLPLYELALQLGAERGPQGAPELVVVTAEESPLAAFGAEVSAEVRDLLGGRGATLYTAATVDAFEDGAIWIEFEGAVDVDAVVALPRLHGPSIDGLPHDADGFIPIDRVARVAGVDHVYAAGDVCAFSYKQGGLAAQEADVAAAHIAWKIGAGPQPAPLDLVLRGELLTGAAPRFLRTRLPRGGEEHDDGQVSREPLWWPAAKIAARELGPYLAERLPARR